MHSLMTVCSAVCTVCCVDRGPQLSQLISSKQLICPLDGLDLDRRTVVALLHPPPLSWRKTLSRPGQERLNRQKKHLTNGSIFTVFGFGHDGETATHQSSFLLCSCCASLLQERSTEARDQRGGGGVEGRTDREAEQRVGGGTEEGERDTVVRREASSH
ncbi:hypothetical protein INR49_014591 [Caranx melampygus]|nr:hypothetical protein INR49_014591 [Caranx melampygus]